MKMFLLEDDFKLTSHLTELFQDLGFSTEHFASLDPFLERVSQKPEPDFIILDRLIGPHDSKNILAPLRKKHPHVPVIILSAVSTPNEKTELLNMGADDYVSKPFSKDELAARIRVLLRRMNSTNPAFIQVGNLTIDLTKRTVSVNNRQEVLPAKEFMLLHTLSERQGRIWNKHDLLDQIWGQSADIETNVVEATITNVRRKLNELGANVTIKNARNMGYWVED